VGLDEVLEIMHLARGRYRRIEARLQRRVDAQVCSRAARWQGADFRASFGLLEALDHIWFESGSRYRVQTETGTRTGFVHVQNGVRSHRHDPNNDSASGTYENVGYGDAPPTYRQVWWEPNLLIPEMWLEPNGMRRVSGREAVIVRGLPRWTSHDFVIVTPADSYELVVDRERGVLLGMTLLFDGEVGISDEAVEITFDQQFPETTFQTAGEH
jgi:hypothetical protein